MAFDTLATVRALKEAGIEERQAEAIASGMKAASEAGYGELAARSDIEKIEVKIDFMKWVLGFMVAFQLLILGRVFHVL